MAKVLSIKDFKAKKDVNKDLTRNREPLFISHKHGMVKGSVGQESFEDRVARIRTSIEKLNKLMAELKNTPK